MSNSYSTLVAAHYRAFVRDRTSLFFTFAFPLVFLVTFGLVFHGQRLPSGQTYISSIAPGVMTWGVANGALFGAAFTLMHWRRSEVLHVVRMTPTRTATLLASRYTVSLAFALVQAVVFLGVAMTPVFGLHIGSLWALSLPVLITGLATFTAIGVVVGTYANTPEAVAAVANCIMVPMAFLSGSFFPIEGSPRWLQIISDAMPLGYLSRGVEHALAGDDAVSTALVSCVALAGFTVLFIGVMARTFRWTRSV
jgi:ABC-2 type transport system permease protein